LSLLLVAALLVGNWDVSLSNTIRQETTSRFLRTTMDGLTLIGSYEGGATINLGVFFFGGDRESHNAKLATVSWVSAAAATTLIKGIVDRDRPNHSQTSRWDTSFPSSHTSTYFSLATVYALKYPSLTIPLAVVGAGVAYSRVFLGEHYPTDVLAGAALGIGVGYLTVKLEPQLEKIPFLR